VNYDLGLIRPPDCIEGIDQPLAYYAGEWPPDCIEGIDQPLAYYAGELRLRGWTEAVICLPHDGVATNNITGKRYIDHWREAGFECECRLRTRAPVPQ
jgi:hypothetical protein